MDDVAAFSVAADAAVAAAATVDSGLDDFGLIDYESPGPEPLPETEEPEEVYDENSAADALIDYEESDDDEGREPNNSTTIAPTAVDVLDEHRMDLDDDNEAERPEQSLHDSHLGSTGEEEPVISTASLNDGISEPELEEAEATAELDEAAETYGEQQQQAVEDEAVVGDLLDDDIRQHELEEAIVAVDADTVAATYDEQQQQQQQQLTLDDTDVPETWVFSDGEWMIYLGPSQHSFGADYQSILFAMPLDQLISALHADIALREDMELALEFPSLALTIDQRDSECADISLAQIYNCHAAVVRLGRLSEDLVNSPSLKRIMQIVAEDAQPSSNSVPVPQDDLNVVANGAEALAISDKEPASDITPVAVVEEKAEGTTADLLADAGDDEEEDDEDYVAEGEEEGDFVLEDDDDDGAEEDDTEEDDYLDDVDGQGEADDVVEADVDGEVDDDAVEDDGLGEDADADGTETRVESLSASPTHKRPQDSVVEVVPDCDVPAAKKSRSEDATVQDSDDIVAPL
ncbi:hypothetical protein H4S07_001845 [Coemansia furcata]|uniref:Uncharacterized protein n=1 Tax=Coemansia furcata TaxID=417177 RepID=A0ACC1LMI5_9FUNG|nr:hypothetical protein H4S07_001845 [Coemansia furcata]